MRASRILTYLIGRGGPLSILLIEPNMQQFLLSALLCLLTLPGITQNKPTDKEVSFFTSDSILIQATYRYPTLQKAPFPAIILIHQGGSTREEWLELPLVDQLIEAGYAILAYDIRLHGKSGKDGEFEDLYNNPNRAPLDLLAAIDYLVHDDQVDTSRIGIMGASIGGNLACVAASSPAFPIKSAVSISSKVQAVQNLSGTTDPLSLQNTFHIASREEQDGMRAKWAHELYAITTGTRKVEIATGDKHGSYILREHLPLQAEIVLWFKETL